MFDFSIITLTKPGGETDFEFDYIYGYILKEFSSSIPGSDKKRILVYSGHARGEHPKDIQKGDVLIHLSNESLRYDYRFLPGQNIVLRQYFHPFVWRRNVYAIPLGWQTGFRNLNHLQGSHDKHKFCFVGQIKGYRKPMYDAFCNDEEGFFSVSQNWNSRQLSNEEVQRLYLDSAFALVPFGSVHADTMRIMEVLEWGCIPVVIKYMHDDYYKYIFGKHPFIVGKNWDDCKRQVDSLWRNKEALSLKLKQVTEWYNQYKEDLIADVNSILSGLKPTRGSQWKWQILGRLNPYVLASWYYHFYFKKKPIY